METLLIWGFWIFTAAWIIGWIWLLNLGGKSIDEHNKRVYAARDKARKEGRQDAWLATRDDRGSDMSM